MNPEPIEIADSRIRGVTDLELLEDPLNLTRILMGEF